MTYRELFEMAYQKAGDRSPHYKMTYHVGDPDTEASFAQLRADVKAHNRENPDAQKKIYTRGRLGVNNPAKDKEHSWIDRQGNVRTYKRYPSGLPSGRGGEWGSGWSNVDREDATRFDVYVKDKAPHEFGAGLKAEKARMAEWRRRRFGG